MEKSPPHTQDQNSPAKRSGGVIIGRARAMKNTANLPEILQLEILTCAAYLLNKSPTKLLNWEILIGYFERLSGNQNSQPLLNYLVLYGCRAYLYIKKQLKLDRLKPRAYIGYLVGYISTNVFRIQILSQKTIVETRDVVFDITKRYNLQDN